MADPGRPPTLAMAASSSFLGATAAALLTPSGGSAGTPAAPAAAGTPSGGAPDRAAHTTTTTATVAAALAQPMRYMSVNGVDYPAVVAAHIPKYYLPKPHLQRQKYPDSAVLRCYVDPDVIADARAAYTRYAEQVLAEAAGDPYAAKFRPKVDPASVSLIANFRFGGSTLGAPSPQQLVLEWDDDTLPVESVEKPLLAQRDARPEPFLVRVPAGATPAQALPIVLKTLIAEAKGRLRENSPERGSNSPSRSPARGSPAPFPHLAPPSPGSAKSSFFAAWDAERLRRLVALCDDQLTQLAADEARERAEAERRQQVEANPRRMRRGRRRSVATKPSDAHDAPSVNPGEDGKPPRQPPSIGLRPCDVNGDLLAPEPPAQANAPAPLTSKSSVSPARGRNRRPSVNFGGLSPLKALAPSAVTPTAQPKASTPQPLSPMAGASAASPTVTKHALVRRQLDPAAPLVSQLTMPFNVAITVNRERAREFVRHSNVAARVVQQREVREREARRQAHIAGRQARVQDAEEHSRAESVARDAAVREQMRQQASTSLKEVVMWQRERAVAERNARLAAAAEAKRVAAEAEEAAIRTRLRDIAAAKAACAFDEQERRSALGVDEAAHRGDIEHAATVAAAAIAKQRRIRERMSRIPAEAEASVLAQASTPWRIRSNANA